MSVEGYINSWAECSELVFIWFLYGAKIASAAKKVCFKGIPLLNGGSKHLRTCTRAHSLDPRGLLEAVPGEWSSVSRSQGCSSPTHQVCV